MRWVETCGFPASAKSGGGVLRFHDLGVLLLARRLIDDTRQFLLKLVPAAYPYLHNDIHRASLCEICPSNDP